VSKPLGIRNCNPGNIRRDGTKWVGQDLTHTGPMAKFTGMRYGIRASALLLANYYRRRKLRTIRAVISRWAPPVENDTESYIANVGVVSGLPVNRRMKIDHPDVLLRILRGIFRHENGRMNQHADWLKDEEIWQGILLVPGMAVQAGRIAA
jgi:hypothetical protein